MTPPRFPDSSRNPAAAPARSGPACSSDQSSTTGRPASRKKPATNRTTPPTAGLCTTAMTANATADTTTAISSMPRRWSRRATMSGSSAPPAIPPTVMIAIR